MSKIFHAPVSYLMLLFAFAFSTPAFSQDDIIKRNDDVIKAKVEEVGEQSIKFRKADNMDGPLYVISRSEVYMIVYNNGDRDVITPRGQESVGLVEAPIRQAPPELPVYEQPLCPVEGYLWTPGYWAFGPGGYYWVPGVWVMPPHIGYLWTPCYWGYEGGIYGFHEGYWGEHIGFYGGVDYGYGYGGSGYEGGRWEGGSFRYNTYVTRVDVSVVHTTYVDNTVVRNNTITSRASFNGDGGVKAQPTSTERNYSSEKHVNATPEQRSHFETAKSDKSQYASANGGKPMVTAMNKPGGSAYSPAGKPAELHPGTAPAVAHPSSQSHGSPSSTPASHPGNETHGAQPGAQPSHSNPSSTSSSSHPGNETHGNQPSASPSHPYNESHPANESHPGGVQHPANEQHGPSSGFGQPSQPSHGSGQPQQSSQPSHSQPSQPSHQSQPQPASRPAPKPAPAPAPAKKK